MYNAADESVQFRATTLFSLQRRRCSIHNGRGVQPRRRIHTRAYFYIHHVILLHFTTKKGRSAARTALFFVKQKSDGIRFFKTFFCSRYFISTKSFWKNSNRIWHKGAQNFRVGRYFAKKHCCIKFSKQVMIEHMKTCMEK